MCDGTETGYGMTDATDAADATETAGATGEQQQEQTLTQADVDKLIAKVRGEERRKASERFADYDELKTQAEGAKTLEQRLAEVEGKLTATQTDALRTRIAAKFGISSEKGADGEASDADLFLTGTDESTLTAQAQRLAARQSDSKKQGNVAPNEGGTKNIGKPEEQEARDFVGNLFGGSD